MEITVYIDVLFCTNFIFDYLLLWLTGLLTSCSARLWRMLLAAATGALYSVFVFFFPGLPLGSAIPKLLAGAAMCVLCFRPGKWQTFLRSLCIFYAVSFLYGGIIYAFLSATGIASRFGVIWQNGVLYLNLPLVPLFCLSLGCYLLLSLALRSGSYLQNLRRKIVSFSVCYQGKTVSLRGLYDSGNLLQNPADGKSVIIAEWEAVAPLFPGKSYGDVTRLIPYETLSGKGLLPIFLPHSILVGKEAETENFYIGLVEKRLDRDKRWNAILPHNFKGVSSLETRTEPDANPEKNNKPPFCLAMLRR